MGFNSGFKGLILTVCYVMLWYKIAVLLLLLCCERSRRATDGGEFFSVWTSSRIRIHSFDCCFRKTAGPLRGFKACWPLPYSVFGRFPA